MAVIFAESVAITKSRLAKGFNGDNLNLNGKVISAQDADNGFKAAGRVKPPYVAVIASGNQKGFAAGAVAAFNDYVKDINLNKYNAEAVIGKYFDDMQSVVENCGIEEGKLSIGIVCAYDDCVVAAKSGNCHLLRFSEGELFEIALSDDEGGRGYQFVDVIADGDIFALIGEEASTDLDYDGIVNTFDSEADLKTMIKDFYKLLAENARGKDCSVVLIKLESDTERTYAASPFVAADTDIDDDGTILATPDSFVSEDPVESEETYETDDVSSEEENAETEKKPVSAKKKILSFIPIAVLVIILAVAAALYFATNSDNSLGEGLSDIGDTPVFDEATSDELTEITSTQDVEETELDEDADDNTTTEAPETTTAAPETTTRAPQTTTRVPETTTNNTTENTETTTDNTTESTETTTEAPADEPEAPPADEPEEPQAEAPINAEPAGDE